MSSEKSVKAVRVRQKDLPGIDRKTVHSNKPASADDYTSIHCRSKHRDVHDWHVPTECYVLRLPETVVRRDKQDSIILFLYNEFYLVQRL